MKRMVASLVYKCEVIRMQRSDQNLDDYDDLNRQKLALTNNQGLKYHSHVKTLRPNYFRVWFDILLGYSLLITSLHFT